RQFNVVVLGAGGVGKSALTVRFVRDVFVENYDPTIEEQYHRPMMVDNELSSLEVLDTAGAEQFTSLNEVYIKSGRGFVLVFRQVSRSPSSHFPISRDAASNSLTQEVSLKEVESLRKQIFRIKGSESVPIVVVGTKSDLVSEREVPTTTIESLASRWNLPFYETSAKRNWHINDVFEDLLRQMRVRYPPDAARKQKKKKDKGPCIIM
ncbi:P-loop containing nucleoside triphosphate hydrolase protein, partial [Mycena filopes]